MRHNTRAWLLVGAVVLICAAVLWVAAYYRSAASASAGSLLRRLPTNDATIFYLDFDAIRRADALPVLTASGVGEDSEYRRFVERTGFDYRHDLDSALVSMTPTATRMFIRGRFDWKALDAFAISEGGQCRNTLCWMPGSTPDRKISFYPVHKTVMALAVSPDVAEVTSMMGKAGRAPLDAPAVPFWLFVPGPALARFKSPLLGTEQFVRAMSGANSVLLTLAPQGQDMEARLEVDCRTVAEADVVERQLRAVTSVLSALISEDKKSPNRRDLSGVLTAGTFTRAGVRVSGRWPVAHELLQSVGGAP